MRIIKGSYGTLLSLPLLVAALSGCGGVSGSSSGESTESEAEAISAQGGLLMVYSGVNGLCLEPTATGIVVRTCGGQQQLFNYDGESIRMTSSPSICVTRTNTDAITLTACVNGAANQNWHYSGGVFMLANDTKCLDVSQENTQGVVSAKLCSGARSQIFWPAGFRVNLHPNITPGAGRCLDLQNDQEVVGTPFDITTCNNTNAQKLGLDSSRHIRLVNKPGLCIQVGNFQNGSAGLTLQSCQYGTSTAALQQTWALIPPTVNSIEAWYSYLINPASAGCLTDVNHLANPSPVSVSACKIPAPLFDDSQRWNPGAY